MNYTTNNNIKRTKDKGAAGFMNINHVVCGSLELIRWNQNRDDNRWAPANEIVVCALVPPTSREPGSS